jgi:sortase A
MRESRWQAWRSFAEGFFWTVAVVCLSSWGAIHLSGAAGARHEMARFAAVQAASRFETGTPDQSLWSAARIKAWQNALNDPAPAPLGILRVPRLRIEVPILEGTDDATLNRGVGHIEDTARPGSDGNAGLAGHRDGFFRALKDIAPGDAIELQTLEGQDAYRVERTWIVDPDDVSVLDPTPNRSLTLVTCYPFYFVGSAPQRFIVRAVVSDRTP